MAQSKKEPIWVYPIIDKEWVHSIIKEFNIHPVTAQILAARGFKSLEEIHNYLYAKLPNLYDPGLFRDMSKAVERIAKALKNRESILIYGDNDVDGMTATALLVEFLKKIGGNVYFFIPNSNSQKKSIITDALDFAIEKKCSLIITVDCGITAADEIQSIVSHNIDVIITDHHEPTSKIPNCVATLNPKLVDSTYPNRNITGVGVAFKLAHALTNNSTVQGELISKSIDLQDYLDLVALGTIADMGSLLGENRILVRYGLKQIRNTKRAGLARLLAICELNLSNLTPIDIASKVAPRLNSLGRIADPSKGVDLLLLTDPEEATSLVYKLDLHNIERQKIERIATEDIDNYIFKHQQILKEKAIVLYSDKWHPGIIPIITAKIAKQFNRPTIIISVDKGLGKGSARTIPEFPLLSIFKQNEDLFVNFGGHDYAAGLTIKTENIPLLQKRFIDAANKTLKDDDIISKLYLDAEIQFKDLTYDFMESLNLLEPYGNENPYPLLYSDAIQSWPPKVVGKIHLKMFLEQNDLLLEGIAFGMAQYHSYLKGKKIPLMVAFTPHINVFLNKSSIQLQIKDFQIIE